MSSDYTLHTYLTKYNQKMNDIKKVIENIDKDLSSKEIANSEDNVIQYYRKMLQTSKKMLQNQINEYEYQHNLIINNPTSEENLILIDRVINLN